MALTPDDIKNKQFTTTRGFGEGYVETEVDDFLDEVYEEFARLLASQGNGQSPGGVDSASVTSISLDRPANTPTDQSTQIRPAVTAAPTQPPIAAAETKGAVPPSAPGSSPESPIQAATGILALAQRTADEHLAAAQAEADQVLADARRQADELTRELEDKRRNELGSLEAEHSKLQSTIDSLRTFEREYRSRLRAYLDAQLHELDAALSPEPDGAQRFLLDEGSSA